MINTCWRLNVHTYRALGLKIVTEFNKLSQIIQKQFYTKQTHFLTMK